MIDINLMPLSMRKQGRLSSLTIDIPPEMSLGVGGSIIILVLLTNIALAGLWAYKGYILNTKKDAWVRMEPTRKSIDDINKEATDLRNKIGSITKATLPKSVGWSKRMNILSDAVAKGMWFSKLMFDSTKLTIEGFAVSKSQSDLATVNTFITTLRKDTGFMADFSDIEMTNITKEKRGMVEISKFTITAKLK